MSRRIIHIFSLSSLLLLCFIFGATAQTTIQGTILNPSDYPLSDVEVKQGGIVIANTNDVGYFSVEINPDSSLLFYKKGYYPYRAKWKGSEMVIHLRLNKNELKVPIPYGNVVAKNLTSSVGVIWGSELNNDPSTNFSFASVLQGLEPGLTVMRKSIGGDGLPVDQDLYVRGLNTYNDNGVRLFVDGFETTTLRQLVPSEIKSISVLKDAAALAPLGLRGSNGVLWVETQKGTWGKKRTKISLHTSVGIGSPINLPQFMDAAGYAFLYNEAKSNDAGSWSPFYSYNDLVKYKYGRDSVFYPNINWYDRTLRNSVPNEETSLSFDGGGEKFRFFAFLGHRYSEKLYKKNDDDKTGMMKTLGSFTRYNFRVNLDAKLNKIFSAGVSLGGMVLKSKNPTEDLFSILSHIPPNAYAPVNPDGTWGGSSTYPNNPVAILFGTGMKEFHNRSVDATINLEENLDFITKGLRLSESVNFNNWLQRNYDRTKNYESYLPQAVGDSIDYVKFGESSDYLVDDNSQKQWGRRAFDIALNYDKEIGDNKISGLLRYEQNVYTTDGNNPPHLHAGISGRLKYNYLGKYLGTFAFSYMGSENYPTGKKYGFFPAVSGAWIISKEDFMKETSWVNYLKVRASAGWVGNDSYSLGRFLYQQYYVGTAEYVLGVNNDGGSTGLKQGNLANPNISWETSYMYNFGINGTFLNNKVAIGIDLFYDKTKDILSKKNSIIPTYLGIPLPYENVGKVVDKGIDAKLTFQDRIGDFSYSIGSNFSFSQNKILFMAEGSHRESWSYRTGKPIGQSFGLEAIGFFNSEDEINNSPVQVYGAVQPGDIKYKDQNQDGLIDDDDVIPMGYNDVPEITYALKLHGKFKGFYLNLFFYGVSHRSIYIHNNEILAFENNGKVPTIAKQRWAYYPQRGIDTRATAKYPRLSLVGSENNNRESTFWLKNGDYLRLRNVEIGYIIPQRLSEKVGLTKIKIYIGGTDLFSLSSLRRFDPEFWSGYPLLKSFNLGLNLDF